MVLILLRKQVIWVLPFIVMLAGIFGCGHRDMPDQSPQKSAQETDSAAHRPEDGEAINDIQSKASDPVEAMQAEAMQKLYNAFSDQWENYGVVDIDMLVELYLYCESKTYKRGDVPHDKIKNFINDLNGLSQNINFHESDTKIVRQAKRTLYDKGHVKKYNKEKNCVLDYFLHDSIQCAGASRTVMLITMLAQWRHFTDRNDFMKNCKDNLFVYSNGHVQPGWLHHYITIADVLAVESTEKTDTEINIGSFSEMEKKKMPIRICRADYVFMTFIAECFNDRLKSSNWKKEAVLFENKIDSLSVSVQNISPVGNDIFGFGNMDVPEGDHAIGSTGQQTTSQQFLLKAKSFDGEPIIKRKTKIDRTVTNTLDFEKKIIKLPLSDGEKIRCLDLLSAYLRHVNKNHIQHLNYLNKEIMKQINNLGFDFNYALSKDTRGEYVSGMFSILGKSAAGKAAKRTGNTQIPWEEWYELIAAEADEYKNNL